MAEVVAGAPAAPPTGRLTAGAVILVTWLCAKLIGPLDCVWDIVRVANA